MCVAEEQPRLQKRKKDSVWNGHDFYFSNKIHQMRKKNCSEKRIENYALNFLKGD